MMHGTINIKCLLSLSFETVSAKLSKISRFWHWDKSCNDFRNCAKLFLFMNSKYERVHQNNSNFVELIRFRESERLSFTKKFSSSYVKRRFIALFTAIPTWMQSKLYCFKFHFRINFPFTPPQLVSVFRIFHRKPCVKFSPISCMPHIPLSSSCLIWPFYLARLQREDYFIFKTVNILENKRPFLPNPYSSIIR